METAAAHSERGGRRPSSVRVAPREPIPISTPQQLAERAMTRWRLEIIPLPLAAHQQQIDELLEKGWEPFASNEQGLHLRLRLGEQPGAVVVNAGRAAALRSLLPGWRPILPLARLAPNSRWPRIVMLWRPTTELGWKWADRYLRLRISSPEQKLEWLA